MLLYHTFLYNENGNQDDGYIILLSLRWNASCFAGVEAELELESESIFSVRSRSWSRSLLKFVDSAALTEIFRYFRTELRSRLSIPNRLRPIKCRKC